MNLIELYLLLLGVVDLTRTAPAKHALLDYFDAARAMEMMGAPQAAAQILQEGAILGIGLLIAEGHDPEVLKGADSPVIAAVKRRSEEARAQQKAGQAAPFNPPRIAVAGPTTKQ
jgi:hypothetical protein